jgi:hypothetical protein
VAGLGLGIAWLGYSVLYYGITQIQGQNFGLLDLMFPTRWATAAKNPPPMDSGSASSVTAPATAATASPQVTPAPSTTAPKTILA